MALFERGLYKLDNTSCYKDWAYRLRSYIGTKGLLGYITGSRPRPRFPKPPLIIDGVTDSEGSMEAVRKWEKDDAKWTREDMTTRSTIYACLSYENRALLDNVQTAKEMWDTLKRHHQRSGFAFKQQLFNSLNDMNIRDCWNDVQSYVTMFIARKEDLTMTGFSMDAEGYIYMFLRGLGTQFEPFQSRKRAHLNQLDKDVVPSLENLIEELLEEASPTSEDDILLPLSSSDRKRARSSHDREETG